MKTDSENVLNVKKSDHWERSQVNLDLLISKMKEQDERHKKVFRRFSIMMIVLVFFYAALLIVNPDPDLTLQMRLSGTCYVIAFLTGAYLFRKAYREMAKIDYSEPLLTVLKQASQRIGPNKKGFFSFLLVPLFINLGLSVGVGPFRYMPVEWSPEKKMFILQLAYWGIMIIAGTISYIISLKKIKPYRDAVNEMIRELEAPGNPMNEI